MVLCWGFEMKTQHIKCVGCSQSIISRFLQGRVPFISLQEPFLPPPLVGGLLPKKEVAMQEGWLGPPGARGASNSHRIRFICQPRGTLGVGASTAHGIHGTWRKHRQWGSSAVFSDLGPRRHGQRLTQASRLLPEDL